MRKPLWRRRVPITSDMFALVTCQPENVEGLSLGSRINFVIGMLAQRNHFVLVALDPWSSAVALHASCDLCVLRPGGLPRQTMNFHICVAAVALHAKFDVACLNTVLAASSFQDWIAGCSFALHSGLLTSSVSVRPGFIASRVVRPGTLLLQDLDLCPVVCTDTWISPVSFTFKPEPLPCCFLSNLIAAMSFAVKSGSLPCRFFHIWIAGLSYDRSCLFFLDKTAAM